MGLAQSFSREEQQNAFGQTGAFGGHDILDGSQQATPPGVGVAQMGAPVGHRVSSALQQNTLGSNGHMLTPGGHDINRGSQHPNDAHSGKPGEHMPSCGTQQRIPRNSISPVVCCAPTVATSAEAISVNMRIFLCIQFFLWLITVSILFSGGPPLILCLRRFHL